MKRTVVLHGRGGSIRVLSMETDNKEADVRKAIREVALAYGRTGEGRRYYLEKCGLTYEEFFDLVPDEIGMAYGIKKWEAVTPDLVVESREKVLTAADVAHLASQTAAGDGNGQDIYEVALRMAVMWGVMQTLEERYMPENGGMGFLLAWAEEYVQENRNDLPGFFKEKMERGIWR